MPTHQFDNIITIICTALTSSVEYIATLYNNHRPNSRTFPTEQSQAFEFELGSDRRTRSTICNE